MNMNEYPKTLHNQLQTMNDIAQIAMRTAFFCDRSTQSDKKAFQQKLIIGFSFNSNDNTDIQDTSLMFLP